MLLIERDDFFLHKVVTLHPNFFDGKHTDQIDDRADNEDQQNDNNGIGDQPSAVLIGSVLEKVPPKEKTRKIIIVDQIDTEGG